MVVGKLEKVVGGFMRKEWRRMEGPPLTTIIKILFNPVVLQKWSERPVLSRSISKNIPALKLSHCQI